MPKKSPSAAKVGAQAQIEAEKKNVRSWLTLTSKTTSLACDNRKNSPKGLAAEFRHLT
jgi:hypothetical protein